MVRIAGESCNVPSAPPSLEARTSRGPRHLVPSFSMTNNRSVWGKPARGTHRAVKVSTCARSHRSDASALLSAWLTRTDTSSLPPTRTSTALAPIHRHRLRPCQKTAPPWSVHSHRQYRTSVTWSHKIHTLERLRRHPRVPASRTWSGCVPSAWYRKYALICHPYPCVTDSAAWVQLCKDMTLKL